MWFGWVLILFWMFVDWSFLGWFGMGFGFYVCWLDGLGVWVLCLCELFCLGWFWVCLVGWVTVVVCWFGFVGCFGCVCSLRLFG